MSFILNVPSFVSLGPSSLPEFELKRQTTSNNKYSCKRQATGSNPFRPKTFGFRTLIKAASSDERVLAVHSRRGMLPSGSAT